MRPSPSDRGRRHRPISAAIEARPWAWLRGSRPRRSGTVVRPAPRRQMRGPLSCPPGRAVQAHCVDARPARPRPAVLDDAPSPSRLVQRPRPPAGRRACPTPSAPHRLGACRCGVSGAGPWWPAAWHDHRVVRRFLLRDGGRAPLPQGSLRQIHTPVAGLRSRPFVGSCPAVGPAIFGHYGDRVGEATLIMTPRCECTGAPSWLPARRRRPSGSPRRSLLTLLRPPGHRVRRRVGRHGADVDRSGAPRTAGA